MFVSVRSLQLCGGALRWAVVNQNVKALSVQQQGKTRHGMGQVMNAGVAGILFTVPVRRHVALGGRDVG